ncbi:hypothetical protein KJ652_02740 [Patescibacteria group bacterium]|nr:hypothetical protein [Patescibacteria group bacterium]MBU1123483.1 hypothetical protein [Patescibacteria group bacterium]
MNTQPAQLSAEPSETEFSSDLSRECLETVCAEAKSFGLNDKLVSFVEQQLVLAWKLAGLSDHEIYDFGLACAELLKEKYCIAAASSDDEEPDVNACNEYAINRLREALGKSLMYSVPRTAPQGTSDSTDLIDEVLATGSKIKEGVSTLLLLFSRRKNGDDGEGQ